MKAEQPQRYVVRAATGGGAWRYAFVNADTGRVLKGYGSLAELTRTF